MSKLKITKSIYIKAPASHIWKFLTEADKLAEWFHRGTEDFQPGGKWGCVTNSYGKEGSQMCSGSVLEFTPHTRFVHTFTHPGLKGIETTCTWTLEEHDEGTIVNLVHDGWENVGEAAFSSAADHDKGWDEHLSRLRKVGN